MIDFAEKIGELKAGLKSLISNFDGHLKNHKIDRIMQWIIIFLQTIVILFLGYMKYTGKI